MNKQKQTVCLVCAWRANCVKRFNMGSDETLYCPDFSEDLTLRKVTEDASSPDSEDSTET